MGTVRPESAEDPQGKETRTTSSTGGEKGVKAEVFDQMPLTALFDLARVYNMGAQKYSAHNFRKGYEWSKSFNSLMRHLLAFWGGEDLDPESGLPHISHAAWHCFTLHSFMIEHPEHDDRYKGVADSPDGYGNIDEWANQ